VIRWIPAAVVAVREYPGRVDVDPLGDEHVVDASVHHERAKVREARVRTVADRRRLDRVRERHGRAIVVGLAALDASIRDAAQDPMGLLADPTVEVAQHDDGRSLGDRRQPVGEGRRPASACAGAPVVEVGVADGERARVSVAFCLRGNDAGPRHDPWMGAVPPGAGLLGRLREPEGVVIANRPPVRANRDRTALARSVRESPATDQRVAGQGFTEVLALAGARLLKPDHVGGVKPDERRHAVATRRPAVVTAARVGEPNVVGHRPQSPHDLTRERERS
jgi:hypothetical protein